MERKEITGHVKAVAEDGRDWDIEIVCSTDEEDRGCDTIDQAGWDLDAFRRNPVFITQHQHKLTSGSSSVIGSFREIGVRPGVGLVGRAVFADTALGTEYKRLYKDGHMSAVSVGFLPIKWKDVSLPKGRVRRFTRMELMEVSACAVPSNRSSLVTVRGVSGPDGDALGVVTRGQLAEATVEIKLTLVSAIAGAAACLGDTEALHDYEHVEGNIRKELYQADKAGPEIATAEDVKNIVADVGIFMREQFTDILGEDDEVNGFGKAVLGVRDELGDKLGDEMRGEGEGEGDEPAAPEEDESEDEQFRSAVNALVNGAVATG